MVLGDSFGDRKNVEELISFEDVLAAAGRLKGIAHRTPLITSRTLDATAGTQAFVKCENFQRTGAFKFRGAYNRLATLTSRERAAGVVAFSSGNHGQGVALAARLLHIPASIVMPIDASPVKARAVTGYGAEVVCYNPSEHDRARFAEESARERNALLVDPCDEPEIIAGQGTVALELLQDAVDIDALIVPTSGGGLLAGCAIAAKALAKSIAVYGVEPEAGDDFAQSFMRGQPIQIPFPQTIADGLTCTMPGTVTFPIVMRYCAGIFTVSEDDIRTAVHFAFERLKMVVEPSGAVALAAILSGRFDARSKRVGIILSGGNVDAENFARIIASNPMRPHRSGGALGG